MKSVVALTFTPDVGGVFAAGYSTLGRRGFAPEITIFLLGPLPIKVNIKVLDISKNIKGLSKLLDCNYLAISHGMAI